MEQSLILEKLHGKLKLGISIVEIIRNSLRYLIIRHNPNPFQWKTFR